MKQNDDVSSNENIFECIANENNWTVIKIEQVPFKFAPRFGHCSIMIPMDENENNSKSVLRQMVVFGGYAGEMSVLNDFWLISIEMNAENGACKLRECKCLGIKDLPSPRHGHSMNLMNGSKLVIYGGIDLNFQTFHDVHVVNIRLKEWKNEQKDGGGGGMSVSEKESAKQQLQSMGFGDQQINAALQNAQNFEHALGILLG